MERETAVKAAERIGKRAGALAAAQGVPRPNPFTGRKGTAPLAEAWQRGYDRASHPSAG